MCLSIDISFVTRLRPYLKMFKHTGGYNYVCRCPFCGDSKKSAVKHRGSFFRGKNETSNLILFSCFNCGVSTTLGKVIQHVSPTMYDEYKFAVYRENRPESVPEKAEVDESLFKPSSKELDLTYDAALDNILRLDTLSENHPAVLYLKSRKIPQDLWHLFYFAPKFMAWTNTLVPGKFEIRDKDYPRLIIPSFNEHGKMFGYAGRAFGDETPKYFNVKLDEDEEKVYGRERLDYSQPIYVVEGQVDSMLIDNAIAVAGSSFDTPYVQGIKTNCTLVPDCEPRNPQIVAQYRKYIAAGYKVCMLPESFVYKDINEAVIGNMTPKEIIDLINANSYQGLSAEIKFASWSKCSEPKRPVLVQNNTNRINTLGSIKLNF